MRIVPLVFLVCVGFEKILRPTRIALFKLKTVKSFAGTEEQSNTQVSADDMCSPEDWPSHAHRYRPQTQNGTLSALYPHSPFLQFNTE